MVKNSKLKSKFNNQETINFLLLKIGEKEFMRNLYTKGELYISRVSTFSKKEEKEKEKLTIKHLRYDKYEGVSKIYHNKSLQKMKFQIGIPDESGEIVFLPIEGITEATFKNKDPFIFCSYSISDKSGLDLIFLKKHININSLKNLGSHYVLFYDLKELYKRIKSTFPHYPFSKITLGAINYIDVSKHDGDYNPFLKSHLYDYQSEFRMLFEESDMKIDEDNIKIYIGPLKNYAYFGNMDNLINEEIFVGYKDKYPPIFNIFTPINVQSPKISTLISYEHQSYSKMFREKINQILY